MTEPRTETLLDDVYTAIDRLWALTRRGDRPAMGTPPGKTLLMLVGSAEGKLDECQAEARAAVLGKVRAAMLGTLRDGGDQFPDEWFAYEDDGDPTTPVGLTEEGILAAIDALVEKP